MSNSAEASDLLITMRRPAYPLAAREKFITGNGKYAVILRADTGGVKRVTVLESTGSKILDDAAVKPGAMERARRGRVSRMDVPFTFTFAR